VDDNVREYECRKKHTKNGDNDSQSWPERVNRKKLLTVTVALVTPHQMAKTRAACYMSILQHRRLLNDFLKGIRHKTAGIAETIVSSKLFRPV